MSIDERRGSAAAAQGTPPTHPSAAERVLERCSEALGPMFIKELRQALRGKAFRRTYLLLLLSAGLLSVLLLTDVLSMPGSSVETGPYLFGLQFAVLCVGLVGLLPVQAYQALGAEHAEHTLDLLKLSGIRPGQIVRGKLFASAALGAVLASAIAPLMALSYLFGSVDLFTSLGWVLVVVMSSWLMCALAAFLSSSDQRRSTRAGGVSLVAFLGAVLCLVLIRRSGFGLNSVPVASVEPFEWLAKVLEWCPTLLLAAMLTVGAQVPLENPRDNPLASLRRLLTGSVLAMCVLCLISAALNPMGQGHALRILLGTAVLVAMGFLALWSEAPSSSFARAERARALVAVAGGDRGPWPAWLRPGGNRACVLYLALASLLALTAYLVDRLQPSPAYMGWLAVPVLLGYLAFYIAVPSGLLQGLSVTPGGRRVLRALVFGFAVACIAGPWLLGVATWNSAWAEGDHPLSVFSALNHLEAGAFHAAILAAIAAAVSWVRFPPRGPFVREPPRRSAGA